MALTHRLARLPRAVVAALAMAVLFAGMLSLTSPAQADDGGSTDQSASSATTPSQELVDEGAPSVTAPPESSAPDGTVANPRPRVANCNNGPAVKWAYGKKVAPNTWRGLRWVCNPHTGKYLLGYCVDRGLPEATVVRITKHRGVLAGYSAEQSKRATDIANGPKSHDWRIAMRRNFALYMVTEPQATVNEMRGYVSNGVISQADMDAAKRIYQASEKHGPYRLKLEKAAKGNRVVGTVTTFHGYKGPKGGHVVARKVKGRGKIVSFNGHKGHRGIVRKNGTFVFRYARGANAVYKAVVRYPSHDTVLMNVRSDANSQRILIGGPRTKAVGKIRVKSVKNSFEFKQVCAEACDGTATVKQTVCHTVGVEGGKFVRKSAGGAFLYGVMVLKKGQRCARSTSPAKDGQTSKLYYCSKDTRPGTKCRGGWKLVKGSKRTIECPEWPKVEIVVGCDCGGAWAKGRFYVSSGLRRTLGYLKATDEDVVVRDLRDIVVTPGQWTEVPITEKVREGLILEGSFSVNVSENNPRQIVPRTVMVRVKVLQASPSGRVTYRQSESVDGKVVNREVKTATVDSKSIANGS